MDFTNEELLRLVPERNLRALARLITLSENRVPRARVVQSELFKKTGKAHVVGVTGSPGAGKSTLVDSLGLLWAKSGKRVAILAIDPTSPFSGGAILGDRIRMVKSTEDSGIFIRSMATRGALGGISRGTIDAVQILDAAGYDLIIIETVGVGQAEVDIVRLADTCLVLLVPGMGDSVQAIKAGILEIADVFVVNKADRDGADLLQKDLRVLISLGDYSEGSWRPEIVPTVAVKAEGVEKLAEAVGRHLDWLRTTEAGKTRRKTVIKETLIKLAGEVIFDRISDTRRELLDELVQNCFDKKLDPYTAVQKLLERF